MHARVLSRDDGHLAPETLTRAAAARLRSGIRALEAWLRRVILCLALQLEPTLQPDRSEYVKLDRPRRLAPPRPRLRMFADGRLLFAGERFPRGGLPASGPRAGLARPDTIWAAPLLARLAALRPLIEAPDARARRLAFHLARRRPGPLPVPGARGAVRPRQFGTEASALYDALAPAILMASRARPPPIGPRPRAGPRIRLI